jgi:hypothetical protein
MRHVLCRPARLKLAAVLPITILWFALAGNANAAVPNADTIDQTTHPSTAWQGDFYATSNPLLDPSTPGGGPQLCLPTSANDALCDHFELNTQDSGPVRVVATWPGSNCTALAQAAGQPGCTGATDNDFDILVCVNDPIEDATEIVPDECSGGYTVAYCASSQPGFEECDFVATAGMTYEIRVLPLFITPPGSDYQGCAEYTDVNFTAHTCAAPPVLAPPPVSSSAFFSCGNTLQRQMDGGGDVTATSNPLNKGALSVSVRRHVDSKGKTHFRGKSNYSEQNAVKFRSENAKCAFFADGTNTADSDNSTTFRGSVEMRGFGQFRQDDAHKDTRVCYRVFAQDWGQPGGGKDHYELDVFSYDASQDTCSGTPIFTTGDKTLLEGNLKYKFVPEGKDTNNN